jgi:hypothetical protein
VSSIWCGAPWLQLARTHTHSHTHTHTHTHTHNTHTHSLSHTHTHTAQHITSQHSTAHHSTAQHSTAQCMNSHAIIACCQKPSADQSVRHALVQPVVDALGRACWAGLAVGIAPKDLPAHPPAHKGQRRSYVCELCIDAYQGMHWIPCARMCTRVAAVPWALALLHHANLISGATRMQR